MSHQHPQPITIPSVPPYEENVPIIYQQFHNKNYNKKWRRTRALLLLWAISNLPGLMEKLVLTITSIKV
jgi:hypothetical protein